ncbi:hypothetical protein X962_5070 [Burkholderia pseudomallei MSHR7343]|nr:hypothetical protein X948_2980 [Burkholderia pseudomallei MSHR5608]KGS23399.1 hypothetical protein X962_5070 [Burkholderia pseudomallei MSHR7343]
MKPARQDPADRPDARDRGIGRRSVTAYSGLMLAAWRPFGPRFVSKLTFWFSASVLYPSLRISEKCANRSSPPESGVMKPKPLVSLNHLTVPVSIRIPKKKLKMILPYCRHEESIKEGEDNEFRASGGKVMSSNRTS